LVSIREVREKEKLKQLTEDETTNNEPKKGVLEAFNG